MYLQAGFGDDAFEFHRKAVDIELDVVENDWKGFGKNGDLQRHFFLVVIAEREVDFIADFYSKKGFFIRKPKISGFHFLEHQVPLPIYNFASPTYLLSASSLRSRTWEK